MWESAEGFLIANKTAAWADNPELIANTLNNWCQE